MYETAQTESEWVVLLESHIVPGSLLSVQSSQPAFRPQIHQERAKLFYVQVRYTRAWIVNLKSQCLC
jgi:hypothetical protein